MNDKINNASATEDDEIDLLELIYTVLDGKWIILFSMLLAVALAFIYAFGQMAIYKADALLQVEKKQAAIPGLDDLAGLGGGEDATVSTEIEIIKSRNNLGKAIDALKLDIKAEPKRILLLGNLYKKFFNSDDIKKLPPVWEWFDKKVYGYAWGNERIDVSTLEVPKDLLNKSLTLISGEKDRYKLFNKETLILEGKIGRLSRSNKNQIKLYVRELVGLSGTQYILEKKSNLEVI